MNWHFEIVEVTDATFGCFFFLSCDLIKAFHQWEMTEEYRRLAAFITLFGLFEFKQATFRVTNGPAFLLEQMLKRVLSAPKGRKFKMFKQDCIIWYPYIEHSQLNNHKTLSLGVQKSKLIFSLYHHSLIYDLLPCSKRFSYTLACVLVLFWFCQRQWFSK
jgi:hypothetical protein